MARYLVFDTEQAAVDCEAIISNRARQLFSAQGYAIDPQGNVIGKTLAGESNPEAQPTVRWDIPRQRLDGKWIVAHPEGHASAEYVLPSEMRVIDVLMNGVSDPVEDYSADWFPVPAFP